MVIYYTQVVLIIKVKYICSMHFPWPEGYLVMYYLLLGLCLLKFNTCVTIFYMFFLYLYWYWPSMWIHTWVALFFFLYPYDFCVVDPALVVLEPLVWLSAYHSLPLHLLLPDCLYNWCLLYLLYWYAFQDVCCTLIGIYSDVHIPDGLVFPLLMVVSRQPVCNENFGSRLIYNLDPVLMNF